MRSLILTGLTAICLLTAFCVQAAAPNPSQSTESLIASLTKVLNEQLDASVTASASTSGLGLNLGATSASISGGVIRPLTNVSKESPSQWVFDFVEAGREAMVFMVLNRVYLRGAIDDEDTQDFLLKQAEQFLRQGYSKRDELRFLLDLLNWASITLISPPPLIPQFVQLVLEINGTPIPDPQSPPNPQLLTTLKNNTYIILTYVSPPTDPTNSQNSSNLFIISSSDNVGNEIRINNFLIQAVPPPLVLSAPKDCSKVYCG